MPLSGFCIHAFEKKCNVLSFISRTLIHRVLKTGKVNRAFSLMKLTGLINLRLYLAILIEQIFIYAFLHSCLGLYLLRETVQI